MEDGSLPLEVDAANLAPTTIQLHQKLLVGASAGIFGTGIIYPLDIIKTQVQSSKQKLNFDGLKALIGRVRSMGLYRGFSACLVGIAPEKAIKLTVNDVVRDYCTDHGRQPIKVHQEILAGSVAGFLQLFITVPYESVKIQLQMQQQGITRSGWEVIRGMGPIGMYRGFVATLVRDVPFCFMFFPLYSNVKHLQMTKLYADRPEPFHVGLVAGIVAGAVSAAIVTPADMLKTRIQQGFNGNVGFFKYAQEVAKAEGSAALYKGWQARVLVIAPLYGIVSLAFEVQKRILSEKST